MPMDFLDSNSDDDLEQPPIVPSRPHELAVEILKFLTAALSLAVVLVGLIGKYSWLSKPWVFSALIVLGLLVLIWFAKPRLIASLRRRQVRKRNQRFIAETDVRLRELLQQFGVFTSSSDNRSLISILRSAHSQNMQAVEQIIVGDYIGNWLDCYREQLTFPAKSLHQFLSQCRQFGRIVQEFNRNYVQRTQRELAAKTPLVEHYVAELEEFRDEYAAFLRAVESWAKGILNYLEIGGVADHPTLWRLAPVNSFERVKPFVNTKLPGS